MCYPCVSVFIRGDNSFRRVLCPRFDSIAAKALTLKILILCLAKYHFLARSTHLLSRPPGLVTDPSNGCNLACPGCVHSRYVKERGFFDGHKGMLPESLPDGLLKRYDPYALQITLYNYGEPLLNPETPKFIRLAKRYLMQTVYERFRKNGNLEHVFANIRKLVQAKRTLGKRTPVIEWQFLAFEHNAHEIPLAIDMARLLGVNQIAIRTPFDVSWDDPDMRPAENEASLKRFDWNSEEAMIKNWNPFPDALEADAIEREFEARWIDLAVLLPQENRDADTQSRPTCNWLYKSIAMDAGGRIFPCCASPGPELNLLFANFDGKVPSDPFNIKSGVISRSRPRATSTLRAWIF